MKILGVRSTQPDPADAADPVVVPWWRLERPDATLDGTPATGSDDGGTGSATGPATAAVTGTGPATATGTPAVTASTGSAVLRTIGAGTAAVASCGTRAAGRALAARAEEPASIVYAIWHCRPKTMAAHHRDIPGISLGRAAEIQQHTIGKALKISGTALSALGDSVVVQWVVAVVAVYVVLAFVFLVL